MHAERSNHHQSRGEARTQALDQYSILDTSPEQSYEDLTELASVICDTPISLVTLVAADRQWFKSERGFGLRETPLALSFCAQAVETGETLIVGDAQQNERFQANALVTGHPHIRFYAGAPIVNEAGQALGTVCVLDTVPRKLTAKQISSLEALARQAMSLLELRSASTYLERSIGVAPEMAEKLELATQVARLGIYSWDEGTDRAYWENERMYEILRRSREEGSVNAAQFVSEVVLPEHAKSFEAALERTVVHGEMLSWRGQIRRGDGTQGWIEFTGRMTEATPQHGRRLLGTARDVTEQVQKEDALRTSLEHIRLAQESARLVLWDWDIATGRVRWTGNTEWIYGLPAENLPTLDQVLQCVHEEDRASLKQAMKTAIANNGPLELGFRVWWPDGSLHSIVGQGSPLLSPEGKVVRMLGVKIDVTNSVVALQQLSESEARAERILESIGDAVIVTDMETRVTRMNGVAESLTGWSLQEAHGQPLSEVFNIVNETTRELVENPADKVKRLGTVVGLANHTVLVSRNKEEKNIDDSGAPIRDESGNLVGIVLVFRDITEKYKSEMELRLSTERLRLATTAAKGMGVFDWHVKSDLFFGDEAFFKIFGIITEDGRRGTTLAKVVGQMHPEDQPSIQTSIENAMQSGADYAEEYRVRSEAGYRWVSARGCCILDEQGRPERFPGVVWDITERKQAEDDLRTSEANLSLAVGTAKLGIWSLDIASDTLQSSAVCKNNFGRSATEDFTYLDLLNAIHPDDVAGMQLAVLDAIQHGTEYRYEYRILWPDRSLHWILASGRLLPQEPGEPLTMVGVTLNTTERKLAEGALIQNEKLAAVGRLASSIAHEINNPLESVTNLLYLAKLTDDPTELREYLETADAELRRASAITNHTLRFHKQASNPVEVACQDLISNVLAIYDSRLKNARVTLQKRKRAHRPVVCFDGEIRQVLGNLISNATDAMSAEGGLLLIRSREGHDWTTGREGLILTIADTGPGMPATTVAKVFEAFFTTKGVGGTGLGLWISKEIVERHHGRLAVRSSQAPGKSGTVFTLFLPFDAISR